MKKLEIKHYLTDGYDFITIGNITICIDLKLKLVEIDLGDGIVRAIPLAR